MMCMFCYCIRGLRQNGGDFHPLHYTHVYVRTIASSNSSVKLISRDVARLGRDVDVGLKFMRLQLYKSTAYQVRKSFIREVSKTIHGALNMYLVHCKYVRMHVC